MFTQEEFESAYGLILGFDNIRKQINDDPKLLTKLFNIYKGHGFDIGDYNDVDKRLTNDIRFAVSDCYISLGYPPEYNRNVCEYFDLLTEVFYRNGDNLNYKEYENVWTSPYYVKKRDYYENIFNLCHEYAVKHSTLARLYTYLLETDKYIAEAFLILIKKWL